jgi:tetratricopeptide (TPR) repeat protein
MNQRPTRKDMKRDELADVMERGVEYAGSHVKTIVLAIGGLLALLALFGAFSMYRGHRAEQANVALSKAIEIYQAPIDPTTAKPDDPENPTFADTAARQARAKTLFQELRDDYGSTDAGSVASVYLAQIALSENQPDQARELWNDFIESHENHLLAGQARVNLLQLDRSQGKGEEVAQTLTTMLDQAEPPLPQDIILHELAITQEQLGRTADAVQSYQRILDEFPQSPFAGDARQKIGALDPSQATGGGLPPGMSMPGMPGF